MAENDFKIPLNLYRKGKSLGVGGVGAVKGYFLKSPDEYPDLPTVIAVKKIRKLNAEKYIVSHGKIMSLEPHPNLVKIHDIQTDKAGNDDSSETKIIMERLQGDLEDLWKNRTLTVLECSILLGQILAGLDYLHQNGIMHRDLKPSNVLLKANTDSPDWRTIRVEDITVKIADYDFVRNFDPCDPGETLEMTTLGTRKYMSPEIREAWSNGSPCATYTEKSDIFAVGVLFFEMLMHSAVKEGSKSLKFLGDIEAIIRSDDDIAAVGLTKLLLNMCCLDKHERKSSKYLLKHQFFQFGSIISKTETDMKVLKQMISNTNAENASLQDDITSMRQQITGYEKGMANYEEKLNSLQNQVAKNLADITSLQKDKSTVEAQGKAKEGVLHKLKQDQDIVIAEVLKMMQETRDQQTLLLESNGQLKEQNENLRSELSRMGHSVKCQSDVIKGLVKGTALQKEANKDMWNGVTNNDAERLESALLGGADPDSYWGDASRKFTPLMYAAESGRVDCLRTLAEHGADVDAADFFAQTPAMKAASGGHVECLKVLKSKGAGVNFRDWKSWTAFLLAAKNGHVDCVEWLAQNGADTEAKNSQGLTALHTAAAGGHLEVVKFLVEEAGADVKAKNIDGRTASGLAENCGQFNVVKYLKRREQ